MNRFAHVFAAGVVAALVAPAEATFHFIQIEQVIGGVNGDTTAQAIQIRFRTGGQHLQAPARFRVWDANGANPIVIVDQETNLAGPSQTGDRVLFASANFANYLDSPVPPNYTLTNLIPESYLAAGSLTFETDNGVTIYWRLSWGGAGYTGSNAGSVTNDADGNFGPAWPGPLPSTGLQALQFENAATALSTNNAADYSLTAAAATFQNYQDQTGTLFVPAVTGACCANGGCVPDVTQETCEGGGGIYQGDGTSCDSINCELLVGACCGSEGGCVPDVSQETCEGGGGTYQGDGSTCETVKCPQPPACPADIVDGSTFQPPPDGAVNAADLAYLLGEWGPAPGSLADFVDSSTFQPPPDGVVDAADLAFLLGEWGPCR